MIFKVLCLSFIFLSSDVFPKEVNADIKEKLLKKLKHPLKKNQMSELKGEILRYGGKSVAALIEVMKNKKYPDNNRWMATFMVGRIMGNQAAPFLVKFLKHPQWMMRMASLKTLLALKEKRFVYAYGEALSDKSLLVRKQALENIRRLALKEAAPMVWAMLYDKKNYHVNSTSIKKGTHFIKDIIKTIGDLKFSKAATPLLSMIQKNKYNYVFEEMNYALTRITGRKTPKGDITSKRRFWQKFALAQKSR